MFSKTNVPPSTPNIPTIPDNNLANYISLIHSYEKLRKNVSDEFKKIQKCLYDLNCVEKRMIDNLMPLTNINPSEEKLSHLIQGWNELINESLKNRQDMAININRTVVEPLKKFQIAFNELKSAIKRYEQLISDCNKYTQKLLEYKRSDRTGNAIVKISRYESQLKQAQADCVSLSRILERELPMFLQKRIEYFQPSLAAFISSGILHSGNELSSINQSKLRLDESYESRQENLNKLFKSIDSLSIISS